MSDLLRLIAGLYETDQVACGGMLAKAAPELRRLGHDVPIPETPSRLPIAHLLPAAILSAGRGPLAAIADAFASYERGAQWRQNPNYTAANIGQRFLANYGYVELVGRGRPWESSELAVGFLLLGPRTHYPAHRHPAAEVYHAVSGVAAWRSGEEPIVEHAVGSAIYHAPHIVHETRAGTEPLLALYCWTGDIGVAARLTSI
jgi:mannose-6-phosphate isomerase-like protein (cupin superfamily)